MKQYLFLALLFSAAHSFGMEDCSRWGACDLENVEDDDLSQADVKPLYEQMENLGSTKAELARYVFLSTQVHHIKRNSSLIQNPISNEAEQLDLREIRNNLLNAQHELKHLEFFGDKPKLCAEKRSEIESLKKLEKLT